MLVATFAKIVTPGTMRFNDQTYNTPFNYGGERQHHVLRKWLFKLESEIMYVSQYLCRGLNVKHGHFPGTHRLHYSASQIASASRPVKLRTRNVAGRYKALGLAAHSIDVIWGIEVGGC